MRKEPHENNIHITDPIMQRNRSAGEFSTNMGHRAGDSNTDLISWFCVQKSVVQSLDWPLMLDVSPII